MKTFFIFCAGRATRFYGAVKQLLPLDGGQTILGRIIDQLERKNFGKGQIYVVSRSDIINDYAEERCASVIDLREFEQKNICYDICLTKDKWSSETNILLGDVIYSHDTLNKIIDRSCGKSYPMMFYGDIWEIYAVNIRNKEVCNLAFQKGSEHHFGKIRHAYRRFINVDDERVENYRMLMNDPIFCYINSPITRDCDSPQAYTNIVYELVNTGLLSFY